MAALGDPVEALRLFEEALAIEERTLGPEHPKLAWTLTALANLALNQKRWSDGIDPAQRALEIRARAKIARMMSRGRASRC